MRVYVPLILMLMTWVAAWAVDDDQEVTLVGDRNFNNSTLIYDGIDISNYQKDIDWSATAKDPNIKYVYIKATEGATHKQHRYRRNLESARNHGIKVGSYHFMRTSTPIQAQFENFISMVKAEEQDLVPLLDVETREGWTVKQLQDSVLKFAQLLEQHYGCKPMIYTSSSYFNNYLGAKFASYPLFIARYAKSEPQLYYGAKWILWQFSDRGRIDGIDALVDLSRFNKGCSVNDIKYTNAMKRKTRNNNGEVPRPKVRHQDSKPEVPLSPKQRREMEANANKNKEKTDAQKRGEEAERKRLKEEEKRKKEEAKRLQEKQKEEERKRLETEKRTRELEKKRQEQEEKRLKEEKKLKEREARLKAEKEKAEQREREKREKAEAQQRRELEKARQERLQQERDREKKNAATSKPAATKPATAIKNANQGSADNDAATYTKPGTKGNAATTRWQDKVTHKNTP